MIAFKILHNGKPVCLAGAPDLSVLSTHITAVGKLGRKTIPLRPDQTTGRITLSVGGLTSRKDPKKDVHMNWISLSELNIGDVIELRVLESPKADPPRSRQRRDLVQKQAKRFNRRRKS